MHQSRVLVRNHQAHVNSRATLTGHIFFSYDAIDVSLCHSRCHFVAHLATDLFKLSSNSVLTHYSQCYKAKRKICTNFIDWSLTFIEAMLSFNFICHAKVTSIGDMMLSPWINRCMKTTLNFITINSENRLTPLEVSSGFSTKGSITRQ